MSHFESKNRIYKLKMDYLSIYNAIILKAKGEKRIKYKYDGHENHHILPKCLGGNNSPENLVLLTEREHFVCHKLLIYIYPKNISLIYAFKFMSSLTFKYNISSRDYKYVKELYRNLPAAEKTKEKRLEILFKINCDQKLIKEHIDDYENTTFDHFENSSIKLTKDNYKSNSERLKKNIRYYNTRGCIVPLKS